MIEYVSQGLHDAAKEAAVLLYSPGTDTFLEDMTRNADRVFYFDEGQELRQSLFRKLIQKRRSSLWAAETSEVAKYSVIVPALR